MNRSMMLSIAAAFALPGLMNEAGAAPDAGGSTKKPKAEVVKIKMSDGREVEFAGKRKMLKDVMIAGSTVQVRFDFRSGETRTFTVPDGLLLQFAGHGASQKIGDETAGEDDVDDMVLAVDDLIARLNAGEWSAKREGGGGFGGASILVKALAEVTQKSVDEIKAFLKAKVEAGTTYQKLNAAFEEDDTVGPVIKRLKKEKAGDTKVDTKALLGSIGA